MMDKFVNDMVLRPTLVAGDKVYITNNRRMECLRDGVIVGSYSGVMAGHLVEFKDGSCRWFFRNELCKRDGAEDKLVEIVQASAARERIGV